MSDYEHLTNADVMSGDEIAEYERDAEFAQDAADEARNAEEAKAEAAAGDMSITCEAEFIDGTFTYCGCEECDEREAADAESEEDA